MFKFLLGKEDIEKSSQRQNFEEATAQRNEKILAYKQKKALSEKIKVL